MSTSSLRGASEWALMVGLVFAGGAIAHGQDADVQPPVIQIGPADADTPALPAPVNPPNLPDLPDNPGGEASPSRPYWIGLAGGPLPPDHVLRAHVEVPENQGLLVFSVVPDGPAAKAGVTPHDILLGANDSELRTMQDLIELVTTEGEKKGQIAIEVLRRGKRETVYLTPEPRPADAARGVGGGGAGGLGGGFGSGFGILGEDGLPKELLRELPMEFRNFGPGIIVGEGRRGMAQIPNGVSVSILKDEGKPAHITLKRGGETWEIVGDDPESLEQVPEDLRPFVEQLLQGASPLDLSIGGRARSPMPEMGDGRLRERLERMEERMQQMMERLGSEREPANESQEQTQ